MDVFRFPVVVAISIILLGCGSDNAADAPAPDVAKGALSTPEEVLQRMYSGWFAEQLPQQADGISKNGRTTRHTAAREAFPADLRPASAFNAKQYLACSEGSASHSDIEIDVNPMLGGISTTLKARSTTYNDCVSKAGNVAAQQISTTLSGTEVVACDTTSRLNALDDGCSGGPYRYMERGSPGAPYLNTSSSVGVDGRTISTTYRSDAYYQHRERIQNSDGGHGYEVFYYSSGSTTHRVDGTDYFLDHRIGRPEEPMHYGYTVSDLTEPERDRDGTIERHSYTIEWLVFGHDSSTRAACSFSEYEVSTPVPVVSRISVAEDLETGIVQYSAAPQSGLVRYEQDGASATLEFLGDGAIEIIDSTGRRTIYRDAASILAAAGDCGPPFPVL